MHAGKPVHFWLFHTVRVLVCTCSHVYYTMAGLCRWAVESATRHGESWLYQRCICQRKSCGQCTPALLTRTAIWTIAIQMIHRLSVYSIVWSALSVLLLIVFMYIHGSHLGVVHFILYTALTRCTNGVASMCIHDGFMLTTTVYIRD